MSGTIAFATCQEFPELTPHDQLAAAALKERGVRVEPAIWDVPTDWRRFDAVIFRSTWYYWRKWVEFKRWLDKLESSGVPVWNPLSVIRENIDKRYLGALAARGYPVLPTEWIDPGQAGRFAEILRERGWTEAIIKPVVSGGAVSTYHVKQGEAPEQIESHLKEAWIFGPAMVQPFAPAIRTEGEYSFIFFGGKFSHAILKAAAEGEFRVQWVYGGKSRSVEVSPAWVAEAERIQQSAGRPLLYARVDMVHYQGKLHLMELELTEPNLFFGDHPPAAARFADCVAKLRRKPGP